MKKKITAITLMLATLATTATLGTVSLRNVVADTSTEITAETYSLTDVFYSSSSGVVGSDKVGENTVTAFTLKNDNEVTIKRSLALKWFEESATVAGEGVEKYFNMKFALKDKNFEKVTLSMDTASAWATEDDKTTNSLTFEKKADGTYAILINDTATTTVLTGDEIGLDMTLALAEGASDGEFFVGLTVGDSTKTVGSFENVGANYAKYDSSNKAYPLKITAKLPTDAEGDLAKTVVRLIEINGQSFDNLDKDGKIVDDAKPVLVVNEEIDSFLLGSQFALDYEVLDVLKSSNLKKTLEFYQYNPSLKVGDDGYLKYSTLSTSKYFMPMTYYVKDGQPVKADTEGATATSVSAQNNGQEYVAIRMTVADGTFNTDETKPVYDLAWYANRTAEKDGKAYLIVENNQQGPSYKHYVTTDESAKENVFNETAFTEDNAAKAFQEALNKEAEKVFAGSNSYIYFPSFEWFIEDNNGYRNLKFTISYKTLSSTSASNSSSLSHSALKLSVSAEGLYEFKIFANDKAGNAMKYYLDGELVEVTTSNVWDIEEIPTFTFNIKNQGLKIDEEDSSSDRRDTEVLDKTYTMDSIDVVGATSLQEEFALYKFDLLGYNNSVTADKRIQQSALYGISYKDLNDKVDFTKTGDYLTTYRDAYIELLIEGMDVKVSDVTPFFTRILEEKDCATEAEWKKFEDYAWNASTQSFKTVKEGNYLIFANYWEKELPQVAGQRATAYKLVVVESEDDVIKGDSNWLKNNVVSVVLFSIAGVMLILIIILLLIKPSDEKVEDIDTDGEPKKSKKKDKKDKKDKKEETVEETQAEQAEEPKTEDVQE